MKIYEFISKDLIQKLNPWFSFEISNQNVYWIEIDGAGTDEGNIHGKSKAKNEFYSIFSSERDIYLDISESDFNSFKQIGTANIIFEDKPTEIPMVTLLHELWHVEQAKRGFIYRIKMYFWNKFYSYENRPHEKEAFEMSYKIYKNAVNK